MRSLNNFLFSNEVISTMTYPSPLQHLQSLFLASPALSWRSRYLLRRFFIDFHHCDIQSELHRHTEHRGQLRGGFDSSHVESYTT